MQFNSYSFVFFFAYVLAVHLSPLPWRVKKTNLLCCSYLFYAAWKAPYLVLIWVSTLVDWYVARALERERGKPMRHVLIGLSLFANLGILAVFKYTNFLVGSAAAVMRGLGIDWHPSPLDIVLPVGISFYTFQTLSYSIDVYRGVLKPAQSFLDYALYVSFFPQLVAGPIVRARDFLPQCTTTRLPSGHDLGWGMALFIIGLWEKTVMADGVLSPVVEAIYDAGTKPTFTTAWVGTFAFAGQIFFDFAGYSTCAIGLARCLGFRLPINFRFPYAAVGFSDFWKRWHISLSSWLRDYLYISLGGNRVSTLGVYRNLAITMLLGGLWHGASWNFVVWGGLHGLYLVVERFFRRGNAVISNASVTRTVGGQVITFLAVCIAWVFFRANTFSDAGALLMAMVNPMSSAFTFPAARSAITLFDWQIAYTLIITVCLLVGHHRLKDRDLEETVTSAIWPLRGALVGILLLSVIFMSGQDRAFIYFQF